MEKLDISDTLLDREDVASALALLPRIRHLVLKDIEWSSDESLTQEVFMLMGNEVNPLLPDLESLVLHYSTPTDIELPVDAVFDCLEKRWGRVTGESENRKAKPPLRKVEVMVMGDCIMTDKQKARKAIWEEMGYVLSLGKAW